MTRAEALEYIRMILRCDLPEPVNSTYTFGPVRVTVTPDSTLIWERLTWADCSDVDARAAMTINPFSPRI